MLHEQTTTVPLSANLYYELDADRYPSLRNEFFVRLRQKYPRAFQRTILRDVGQSSSGDSKSVWSLWECSGVDEKAVVKEAGGILIARNDLPVDERLKRNCDTYSSVKTTGGDLLLTLRSFYSSLHADSSKSFSPEHVAGDIGGSYSSNGTCSNHDSFHHKCRDAGSNSSTTTSDSVSHNSSCETKSQNEAVLCRETVTSVGYDLQPGTDDTASEIAAVVNTSNTECGVLLMQLVDMDASNHDVNSTMLQEDTKNLLVTDKLESVYHDIALPVEPSHTDTDCRSVISICYHI